MGVAWMEHESAIFIGEKLRVDPGFRDISIGENAPALSLWALGGAPSFMRLESQGPRLKPVFRRLVNRGLEAPGSHLFVPCTVWQSFKVAKALYVDFA